MAFSLASFVRRLLCVAALTILLFACVPVAANRRGLYVQIYTTRVGQLDVSTDMRLDRFALLLESDEKVGALVTHLNAYNYTAISMYNLWPVLAYADRKARLRTVLRRLRAEVPSLEHVEGISDETTEMWRRMALYQNDTAEENAVAERLDGFFTEIEFWNGQSSAESLLDCINTMRDVYRPAGRLPGVPLHYSVYIGSNIGNDTLIETLVNSSAVTTFFIAAYVEYPSQATNLLNNNGRTLRRIESAAAKRAMAEPGFTQGVGIILSAEGTNYSAGPEYFMGDWLVSNIAPYSVLARAEESTVSLISPPMPNAVHFAGHQWYEYIFVGVYLENDPYFQSTGTTAIAVTTSTEGASTTTVADLSLTPTPSRVIRSSCPSVSVRTALVLHAFAALFIVIASF